MSIILQELVQPIFLLEQKVEAITFFIMCLNLTFAANPTTYMYTEESKDKRPINISAAKIFFALFVDNKFFLGNLKSNG